MSFKHHSLLVANLALTFFLAVLPPQIRGEGFDWLDSEEASRLKQSSSLSIPSALDRQSTLMMPFFIDGFGKTSLFALRNVTSSPITVRYVFVLANGQIYELDETLRAKATVTLNLAEADFPVVDSGASYGFVLFTVVNSSGQQISNRALSGDYFVVDPIGNFASGGSLIKTSELCRKWTTRFADGGVFDGTSFTFLMLNRTSMSNQVVADFKVYNESGSLLRSGSMTSDRLAAAISTGQLKNQGGLPTFGSIEWTFRSNVGKAYVAYEMSAARRFSVGVAGTCLD